MIPIQVTNSQRVVLLHSLLIWLKEYRDIMVGDAASNLDKLIEIIDCAGQDHEIKLVSSDDWNVVYANDGQKIWEGHDIDSNGLDAVVNHFNHDLGYYEFTDENEIDGETPDNFNDIKGIKKL